jgi:hypothetical protein
MRIFGLVELPSSNCTLPSTTSGRVSSVSFGPEVVVGDVVVLGVGDRKTGTGELDGGVTLDWARRGTAQTSSKLAEIDLTEIDLANINRAG